MKKISLVALLVLVVLYSVLGQIPSNIALANSETTTTTNRTTAPTTAYGLMVIKASGLKKIDTQKESITLTWNALGGITGYQVAQYNATTKKYKTVKTISNSTINTHKIKKLSPASEYRFKVRAYLLVNGSRLYGDYSNELVTATTIYPTKFTSLKSEKTDSLTVKWSKKASSTGYQIHYTTANFNEFAKKINISKNSTTSKKFDILYGGMNYKFRIRTYKKIGKNTYYSAWSSVKNATPKASSTAETEKKILNSATLNPTKTGYKKLDNIVEKLMGKLTTSSMTTYEKTVAVFDYLSTKFGYGATGYYPTEQSEINKLGYSGKLDPVVAYDAYSFLKSKIGYCDDYSAALCVLTRYIGLESYTIEGDLTRKSGDVVNNHNWTHIKIDGSYYMFDAQAQTKVSTKLYYFCKPDGYFDSFEPKNAKWWYSNFKNFNLKG